MKNAIESGKKIISILKSNGYDAYFVGGFVRDFLLKIKSNDIDIATSALPDQVLALFPRSKATGEKYGTVTVYEDDAFFEVTTFRQEGEYLDSRHPSFVAFTKSINDDLKRRDFSINAMAMDENMNIIDHFHGRSDLYSKRIRTVGNPDVRFKEDALRILRAFRFVSKLGFDIETLTFESIYNHKELLKRVANERIIQELKLLFAGEYANKAVHLMHLAGIGHVFTDFIQSLELLDQKSIYEISFLDFMALSQYLSQNSISDTWPLSNKENQIINSLSEIMLVTKEDHFNELMVYARGLEMCLSANHLNRLINPMNDQEDLIQSIYAKMPIHKTCDLAFKGQDILDLKLLDNARLIGDLIDDITNQIITLQLENDYQTIKNYVTDKLSKKI